MTDEILNPESSENQGETAPEEARFEVESDPAPGAGGYGSPVEPSASPEPAGSEERRFDDGPIQFPQAARPEPQPAVEPAEPQPAPAAEVPTHAVETMPRLEDLDFSQNYNQSMPSLSEGDVIKGTVVHIDREGVLVDVGTKSEGIIRRNELSRDPNMAAEDIVKVGETIDVYVMETENSEGNLILSKKRADFEKAWDKVAAARDENRTIIAMVTDRVKGGLVVDLGIRGFVPASHVGNGSMKNNLERYVGQSIPLKVIEVDKERRKVVLSNKLAQDEDRHARKAETVASLQPGQIRKGTVRRLTNYGAFVDLGGIDGLLHISEMSWTRINHPSEVLKEGQELDVVILKMDLDQGRVSLGLRQILPDPWTGIDQRYSVGQLITGTVSRIVPFGAFIQVEGGIEGIIPNSELAGRRGQKGPALQQGDPVEVKVIDVRPDERKMTLSLRQAKQEQETHRERAEVETYQAAVPEREEPRFTIGDAFRAQQQAQAEEAEEADQLDQAEEAQQAKDAEEAERADEIEQPMGAEATEEPVATEVESAEVTSEVESTDTPVAEESAEVTTAEGAAESELEAETQTTEPGEKPE